MTAEASVRKGRKFDQVLKGAHDIFTRDGFDGASVDDIARQSGVSKATLYSYFPDKRLLFMEVAMDHCCKQADEALMFIDASRHPKLVLQDIGNQILDFMISDFGQQIFRVFLAEADRFPEIGRRFYQTGPKVMTDEMVGYFKICHQRGELNIDDFRIAAEQFVTLCKADIWLRVVFGIQTSFSAGEKRRVVDNAVATFMARFGGSPS